MKIKYSLLISFFTIFRLSAQPADSSHYPKPELFANTIQEVKLKKHIQILASDTLEGREAGSFRQKQAAIYIAEQFNRFKLQPVMKSGENASYFQPFYFGSLEWGELLFKCLSKTFVSNKDFFILGKTRIPVEQHVETVFAGYGIETEEYSDYKFLDVKGKAVAIFWGEPKEKTGKNLLTHSEKPSDWSEDWSKKVQIAQKKGALYMILVMENPSEFQKQKKKQIRQEAGKATQIIDYQFFQENVFCVLPGVAQVLFQKEQPEIEVELMRFAKQEKPAFLHPTISLKAQRLAKGNNFTENVLGFIEGTDKKDEIIVVSAHYDHIGKINGIVHNGADDDDNASGTAAILEIAKAFSQARFSGFPPRRSILFIAFSAEEKGLYGSRHYTDNPVFPLAKTVCDINLDMVGRNADKSLEMVGDGNSQKLFAICQNLNAKFTHFNIQKNLRDLNDPSHIFNRSDQFYFAQKGIPVLFLTTGTHSDYHQPSDDALLINFPKLQKVAVLTFHILWKLAYYTE